MNIEHKLEPIEHWIVDGKAYRLATARDIGSEVYRSDIGIEDAINNGTMPLMKFGHDGNYPYFTTVDWKYAYVQDDSLLTPQRTPVPALGKGWYLLTAEDGAFKVGDKITSSEITSGWIDKSVPTYVSIANWLSWSDTCYAARYFGPTEDTEIEPVLTEEPSANPIDWTKPVRTKDGRAVRVLCTDGPGDYPVIGILEGVDGPECWHLSGSYFESFGDDRDLENAPQRIQREYWVNVYKGVETLLWYDTKKKADESGGQRFACVKITIDCEEGEGL